MQPLMPWQVMPVPVAAGYYCNSNVAPVSDVPLISNFSRGLANVQFAPVTRADFNQMHGMSSVSTAMQSPFVSLPVARYELTPAVMAELMNRRMWRHQQSFQQQIPYRPFATPHSMMHPFAMAPMPLLAPQFIPASGICPYPMVKPVFQQHLVQTQPNNDPWKHQGQVTVEDTFNCHRSRLSNTDSQDENWTMPADVKNIWSDTAVRHRSSGDNLCRVSNGEHNHAFKPSVMGSGSALSSVEGNYNTSAADSSQWAASTVATNHFVAAAGDSRLCDRQGIWPTAFGPFRRPPQSNADSISRQLPPGLETQVLAGIGVIGQCDPEMQKNASVEGCDSDSDSVNGDSQDSVGHCSSCELTLATCASHITVSSSDSSSVPSLWHDAVEQLPGAPLQELINANNSSSLLLDSKPSLNTQNVPHWKNMSWLPDMFTSGEEFKSVQCHPHSHSYLSTDTAEGDNLISLYDSYSDKDRSLKQSANAVCKMETSHLPCDAVDQMHRTDNRVLLRDIIAQLSDMLHNPDELHFDDICNALYDKLTATGSANCSTQDAKLDGTLCKSSVSSSVTNPHTSVSDDPLHSSSSAANRHDKGSLVGGAVNRCRRAASHTNTCPANTQTLIRSDHSHVSVVSADTANADSQVKSNFTDGHSLPAAQTSVYNAVSATRSQAAANSDTLLPNMPSLCLSDSALLQRVLSKVAESHLKSYENDSDKHKKYASDSPVEDLLVLLQRWKSS